MIDRRKYQMKNEVLTKLREVFQMHADSLPDCTEFPDEEDMYACRKKVYYPGKSVGSNYDTVFVYAYYI